MACHIPTFINIIYILKQNQFLHFCIDDITVAICPGIANSSESVYIRTFVHYAQCHGYRCAVLNHIGALPSVQVTSSRIFTYGKLFILMFLFLGIAIIVSKFLI